MSKEESLGKLIGQGGTAEIYSVSEQKNLKLYRSSVLTDFGYAEFNKPNEISKSVNRTELSNLG